MDSNFISGMAEILEVDPTVIDAGYALTAENWNSLAIVSTIALGDDLYGILLNGQALSKCQSIADVSAMIEKAKGA